MQIEECDTSCIIIRLVFDQLHKIEDKYPSHALEKHTAIGADLGRTMATLFIEALDRKTNLTLGITGGSSTAGDFAWPGRLATWLMTDIGMPHVCLKNGAMGSTSQLVTSPCIQSIVGHDLDMLFWEFGMNDEFPEFINGSNPIAQYYLRHRVAEAYIRQAIALNPKVIGFVHFWDLLIHNFETPGRYKDIIPDRSFHPTSSVMRYYDAVYKRYFAVNVIGFMYDAGLVRNKSDFLRDAHHPNDFGYDVAVDLIKYCLLKATKQFLQKPQAYQDHHATVQTLAPQIWSYPVMTDAPGHAPLVLPSQRLFGHCLTAWRPSFAPLTPIRIIENFEAAVDIGKRAPGRADRQLRFVVGPCTHAKQLTLSIDVPDIAYVLVDCGLRQASACRQHLNASIDGVGTITPNIDVTQDVMNVFFGWVHKLDKVIDASDIRMRLCSNSSTLRVARIAVMQRM
jgi:hypothetical protein